MQFAFNTKQMCQTLCIRIVVTRSPAKPPTLVFLLPVPPSASALGALLTQPQQVKPSSSPPPLLPQTMTSKPTPPLPHGLLGPANGERGGEGDVSPRDEPPVITPVSMEKTVKSLDPYNWGEEGSPKPAVKPAPPGATVCECGCKKYIMSTKFSTLSLKVKMSKFDRTEELTIINYWTWKPTQLWMKG